MKASLIVSTLVGALLLGGCAVSLGGSSTPTQAPLTATPTPEPYLRLSDEELIQLATLTEPPAGEALDWGAWRIVVFGSEEYIRYFASPTGPLTPEEQAEAEAYRANPILSLEDARARVPGGLREPRWLPDGLVVTGVTGAIGFENHYNFEINYGKPGAIVDGHQKYSHTIRIGQRGGASLPIPTTAERTTGSEIMLGRVQGEPAVFMLPSAVAVPTGCRLAKWVKNDVLLVVETMGFPDLATLMRIAESIQ